MTPPAPPGAVALEGISRSFGPVRALQGARLHAAPGEVHALLGENGAGKSTLVSILSGLLQPDEGQILLGGRPVRFPTPREALAAGVGMVHQHFTLVPPLTVRENIALGLRWDRFGLRLPLAEVDARLRDLVARTGLEVDPSARVEELSVGARQRVEILRILARDPSVLVLDEPTAVLAPSEVETLFSVLRRLAGEGRTVILIAHKLDEVLAVGQRFTVLRRGRTVLEATRSEVTEEGLASAMVGGTLPPEPDSGGAGWGGGGGAGPARGEGSEGEGPVARLSGVTLRTGAGAPALEGVSLEVRRGEIVGIAGVEGNGQRELARVLAGLATPSEGEVAAPPHAGWIPQDRGIEGGVATMDLTQNLALGLAGGGILRWGEVEARAREVVERFDVRARGPGQLLGTLSGGNQQKLIVAREILRSGDLLIAENPTRGLDVAATRFVHQELRRLRDGAETGRPLAVLLISTDLDEVLDLSDRIFVLLRGRLQPVPEDRRTRPQVGALMLGRREAAPS